MTGTVQDLLLIVPVEYAMEMGAHSRETDQRLLIGPNDEDRFPSMANQLCLPNLQRVDRSDLENSLGQTSWRPRRLDKGCYHPSETKTPQGEKSPCQPFQELSPTR
jgi:hypothetical protein